MYCRKCGALLKEEDVFCGNCGTKVLPEVTEEVIQQAEITEEPVSVEVPEPQPEIVKEPVPEEPVRVSEPAPVKETPKKNTRLPLILAVMALLACIGGYFLYQNSPSVKYKKAFAAGEKALSEADFEVAEAQFRLAGEINAEGADQAIKEVYSAWAESYDEYTKKIELYKKAAQEYPDQEDYYRRKIYEVYEQESYRIMESDDYSEIALNRVYDVLDLADADGFDTTELRDEFKTEVLIRIYLADLKWEAGLIARLIDSDQPEEIFEDLRYVNIDLGKLTELGVPLPLTVELEDTGYPYFKCYYANDTVSDDYGCYYGELENDVRTGAGYFMYHVFDTEDNQIYDEIYGSFWEDDLPEGETVDYSIIRNSQNQPLLNVIIHGNLVHGIFDGDFSLEYGDGVVFYGTYDDGYVKVIMNPDPNGDPVNVFAMTEDKSSWLYYRDDQLDIRYTVNYGSTH
ncbi:MAG: zinc-ribbon domain-containing protein [Solobacterium sp.]|nr:zinc-ribbon domain-containing protein [Solobacterium sp.]